MSRCACPFFTSSSEKTGGAGLWRSSTFAHGGAIGLSYLRIEHHPHTAAHAHPAEEAAAVDHRRGIRRRRYDFAARAVHGFRSAEGASRTIEGYEAMHAIRKGQIRWLDKGDVVGQRQFIHALFGIGA
jgi:hypothetical protein